MSAGAHPGSRGEPDAGTPRWVYVSGIIALVLVLLFLIVHLARGGLGGHAAGVHTAPAELKAERP